MCSLSIKISIYFKSIFSKLLNYIIIPTHKSSDYKLSAVKYYLSHSKIQVQTCKILGCSERKEIIHIPIILYIIKND